jgi:hypothetical protein
MVAMPAKIRKLRTVAAILPAAILMAASSAWADQQAKSGNDTLPGVRPQKPIASHDAPYPPEPEPENGDINGTTFNVGKMQVSIHGYVSYAVGFGKPMPGKGSRNN